MQKPPGWTGPLYTGSNKMGFGYGPILSTGFAAGDWWCVSYNGHGGQVDLAVAGPTAKWPDGTLLGEWALWAPGRFFIGPKSANPPSIGFGTAAPGSGKYAAGSVVWNTSSTAGAVLGWRCITAGSPGMWDTLYRGPGGFLSKAMADANQTLTATEAANEQIWTTGALTATRTLTLPHPASNAESYTRSMVNDCTGGNITVSTDTGTQVTLLPGNKALVGFTPNGARTVASFSVI